MITCLPNYGAFSRQFSFPGLVFSSFTHFFFAPFAFSASQTGRRLKINVKKKINHQTIFLITALMSETISHRTVNYYAFI